MRAFEAAPAKTREELRQVVKSTARNIQARASNVHRYTSRGGLLEREGVKFHVDGMNAVVFLNDAAVPYGKYLHEGTRAHVIEPRNRRVLRWPVGGEEFAFAKRVQVSGIKPDPFLYNAADAETPIFEGRLMAALDKVLGGS
ncbi:MAG: hypothetical protein IJN28_00900 [Selenomonadales bacterium]|nr:hypothetical protein [Selenomonadales bacterium]